MRGRRAIMAAEAAAQATAVSAGGEESKESKREEDSSPITWLQFQEACRIAADLVPKKIKDPQVYQINFLMKLLSIKCVDSDKNIVSGEGNPYCITVHLHGIQYSVKFCIPDHKNSKNPISVSIFSHNSKKLFCHYQYINGKIEEEVNKSRVPRNTAKDKAAFNYFFREYFLSKKASEWKPPIMRVSAVVERTDRVASSKLPLSQSMAVHRRKGIAVAHTQLLEMRELANPVRLPRSFAAAAASVELPRAVPILAVPTATATVTASPAIVPVATTIATSMTTANPTSKRKSPSKKIKNPNAKKQKNTDETVFLTRDKLTELYVSGKTTSYDLRYQAFFHIPRPVTMRADNIRYAVLDWLDEKGNNRLHIEVKSTNTFLTECEVSKGQPSSWMFGPEVGGTSSRTAAGFRQLNLTYDPEKSGAKPKYDMLSIYETNEKRNLLAYVLMTYDSVVEFVHLHKGRQISGRSVYDAAKTCVAALHPDRPMYFVDMAEIPVSRAEQKKLGESKILLKLLSVLAGKGTYYQNIDPNVRLVSHDCLKTAYYAEISQNPARRAEKIKKLQEFTLKNWYSLFEKEKKEKLVTLFKAIYPNEKEEAPMLFGDINLQTFTQEVQRQSRSLGNKISKNMIDFFILLTDGINCFSKEAPPADSKCNTFRLSVYELVWGSLIWQTQLTLENNKPVPESKSSTAAHSSSSSSSYSSSGAHSMRGDFVAVRNGAAVAMVESLEATASASSLSAASRSEATGLDLFSIFGSSTAPLKAAESEKITATAEGLLML